MTRPRLGDHPERPFAADEQLRQVRAGRRFAGRGPRFGARARSASTTSSPTTMSRSSRSGWSTGPRRGTPASRRPSRGPWTGPVAEGVARARGAQGGLEVRAEHPGGDVDQKRVLVHAEGARHAGEVEGDATVEGTVPPHTPLRPAAGVTGTRAALHTERTAATSRCCGVARRQPPWRVPRPGGPTDGDGHQSRPASARAARRWRHRRLLSAARQRSFVQRGRMPPRCSRASPSAASMGVTAIGAVLKMLPRPARRGVRGARSGELDEGACRKGTGCLGGDLARPSRARPPAALRRPRRCGHWLGRLGGSPGAPAQDVLDAERHLGAAA